MLIGALLVGAHTRASKSDGSGGMPLSTSDLDDNEPCHYCVVGKMVVSNALML